MKSELPEMDECHKNAWESVVGRRKDESSPVDMSFGEPINSLTPSQIDWVKSGYNFVHVLIFFYSKRVKTTH